MQDFIPVIGFVAAYIVARMAGYDGQAIYIATAALMTAMLLQVAWMLLRRKTVERRHWLTLAVIWLLGSLTLAARNDLFIKLKPTVLNAGLAVLFLGSQFVGRENLVKKMLHGAFEMPEALWRRLNLVWVLFFLFAGALNVTVAMSVSNDAYVAFKFWGLMGLTVLFVVAQFVVLRRYLRHDSGAATDDE